MPFPQAGTARQHQHGAASPAVSVQGHRKKHQIWLWRQELPTFTQLVPHQNGSQDINIVQVRILCMAGSQRRYHKTYRPARSHYPKRRDGGAEVGSSSEREGISSHDGKSVLKFIHGTFPSWHFDSSHHNLISGGPQAENARCRSWLEKTCRLTEEKADSRKGHGVSLLLTKPTCQECHQSGCPLFPSIVEASAR